VLFLKTGGLYALGWSHHLLTIIGERFSKSSNSNVVTAIDLTQ
jgi:hypothetical protein